MEEDKQDYSSFTEDSMIDRVSERTGISKQDVKASLRAFRIGFKKFIRLRSSRPFSLRGVFTLYRREGKKTKEQFKNWRSEENDLPYKEK